MAAVQRILPRNWDGRRLLRFLTGLALLALAFTAAGPGLAPAAPAGQEAAVSAGQEAAAPDVREAAAHGSAGSAPHAPVPAAEADAPAAEADAPAALPAAAVDRDASSDTVGPSTAGRSADLAGAAGWPVTVGLPAEAGRAEAGRAGAVRAGAVALPGGVAPGAHGSRGPPRA